MSYWICRRSEIIDLKTVSWPGMTRYLTIQSDRTDKGLQLIGSEVLKLEAHLCLLMMSRMTCEDLQDYNPLLTFRQIEGHKNKAFYSSSCQCVLFLDNNHVFHFKIIGAHRQHDSMWPLDLILHLEFDFFHGL